MIIFNAQILYFVNFPSFIRTGWWCHLCDLHSSVISLMFTSVSISVKSIPSKAIIMIYRFSRIFCICPVPWSLLKEGGRDLYTISDLSFQYLISRSLYRIAFFLEERAKLWIYVMWTESKGILILFRIITGKTGKQMLFLLTLWMTSVNLMATQNIGREDETISSWNITCFLAFKNDTVNHQKVFAL